VVVSALYHTVVRLLGARRRLRQSYAMLAYSLVPIVLSVIILLPIELMTFGMYLFTSNPGPEVIKPVSYYILISLDALCAVWTVGLAVAGTRVVHSLTVPRALLAVGIVFTVLLGSFFLGAPAIPVVLEKVF
ncbi:MAG: YIP1 family protein, partial [Ignavibacteriales bacterium]|nr:YIP1 family protein [Ignavibacteriales bacterium]